jgi:REP element-mobilizing transposase RayT
MGETMGRSRYKFYEPTAPYFITCTTVNWLALFNDPLIVDILFESLNFLQQRKRLRVWAYVVMDNHVHLIISSPHPGKEIGDFKSYTARAIIDHLKAKRALALLRMLSFYKLKHRRDRNYQIWQEGSHPEMIIYEDMLTQKVEYIHNNPVEKRFVEFPEHWLYSSARNFTGLSAFLEIPPLEELLR